MSVDLTRGTLTLDALCIRQHSRGDLTYDCCSCFILLQLYTRPIHGADKNVLRPAAAQFAAFYRLSRNIFFAS